MILIKNKKSSALYGYFGQIDASQMIASTFQRIGQSYAYESVTFFRSN